MIKNVNKTKLIMSVLITLALIIWLMLTLLMTVNYSIENVNWGDFAFSIFYWISGRMTYFPIGLEIGEQNNEVIMLERTISKYRKEIYREKANKLIADKFKYKNIINKTSTYINYLDMQIDKLGNKNSKRIIKKSNKLMKEREEALNFLDKFENKQEYKGKFNINNIRIKYDVLDFATCFSYGNESRIEGHKYKLNVGREGTKKSIPSFIWSLFMSFMSASVSILQYGFTLTALITFVIKLLLFLMGCYNGITLGRSVIETDKYNVLLNITEAVKETITEVEQENSIIIDRNEQKEEDNN